ncbi:AAA family ATPase [Micrococcales bacterium 31B]|nr:AAA family ATPase [Micrococcales bacterium 31B]
MRVTRLAVRNFRSIASLDLPVADYMALVGANGVGKSSLLRALQWAIDGGPLLASDIHHGSGDVQVTIALDGIDAQTHPDLAPYARGGSLILARHWSPAATTSTLTAFVGSVGTDVTGILDAPVAPAPGTSHPGPVAPATPLQRAVKVLLVAASKHDAREADPAEAEAVARVIAHFIDAAAPASLADCAARITERLRPLLDGATVTLRHGAAYAEPESVGISVNPGGGVHDLTAQGQGVRRAVLIATLHALLATPETPLTPVKGNPQAALLLCIEEPEMYQHPIRARAFARVLESLAARESAQVVLATHSPYFVRPQQFHSLRRLTLERGETRAFHTTTTALATKIGDEERAVQKVIDQRLPTAFSEGFFADAVVLVEGNTDKAILEILADRLGRPLDAVGIAVLDMSGKGNFHIPAMLLDGMGIPTYIVADGDSLGAERRHPDDAERQGEVRRSHATATRMLLRWLPRGDTASVGTLPYAFGDPSVVTGTFAIWQDDIEGELAAWPSYVAAQRAHGHEVRAKDMLEYSLDAAAADPDDAPESLTALVTAVHEFRERAEPSGFGPGRSGPPEQP